MACKAGLHDPFRKAEDLLLELSGWSIDAVTLRRHTHAEAAARLAASAGPARNYFAGHRDRLGYAARLHRGQVIGSGLVEGTIKERVNLRLKRTGARWRAERVGPFVELLALADTVGWDECWKTLAARCPIREAHPLLLRARPRSIP